MALPKWLTPAGVLGIIPETEYYEFPLDAYDASGGTLVYKLVSGRLPPGIQLIPTGRLQGIPISELGTDINIEYRFTIRVENSTTGGLSDRTFSITITNVFPPTIIPRNVDLGLYLDGTIVDLTLTAIEFTPGAELTWRLVEGELPPGLSVTTGGVIQGYIQPIPETSIRTIAGNDESGNVLSLTGWGVHYWNETVYYPDDSSVAIGWAPTTRAVSKTFTFSIEVSDGVNYDRTDYTLDVFPRSSLTADNDALTVDTTSIQSTYALQIDSGAKHNPIILTAQDDLVPVRQGSFFSFNVDALDLDGDNLEYTLPIVASGAFDEQDFTSTASLNYVPTSPSSGSISAGVFPKTSISNTLATINLYTGYSITANVGDYITQAITGANAQVRANVLNSNQVTVTLLNSGFAETKGNLAVNGTELVVASYTSASASWSNVGVIPETVTTGEPEIIVDRTSPGLLPGDVIKVVGTSDFWYTATVTSDTSVKLLGNTKVAGNIGDTLTQAISGVSATVNSISDTTGTLTVSGAILVGTIQILGNLVTANVGDFVTQTGSTANAQVTSNVVDGNNIPVRYLTGLFTTGSGNLKINGANVASYPTSIVRYASAVGLTANVGDYITQTSTGANAQITANIISGLTAQVELISGTFTLGSGNISINGTAVNAYPSNVTATTDVEVTYNTSDVFYLNSTESTATVFIANASTNSTPISINSVGVTIGSLATEGVTGFDEGKFDQGTLALPPGLSINPDTGWMTGQLPAQTVNQIDYDFEILVRKSDYPTYESSRLYTLTVLGDLNNRINWITPSNLGTIQNGKVSDLFLKALSTKGKPLVYSLKSNGTYRLPQGLSLTTSGLISGRVSFQLFGLDQGLTTIDDGNTTFDNTYTFTVVASDIDRTVSAERTFTIRVINRNIKPYENLYLKALTTYDQRQYFDSIMQNRTVFPQELIYRGEDPWFGIARDIKTLFLAGLEPSTLEEYMQSADTNHFTKRLTFGDVKTAQALDENFNVKYEVVYLEIFDENTNALGQGPADVIDLTGRIDTPYYDNDGNPYTIAYPNAFTNMSSVIVAGLGYANKGALPDWMTSRQPDGRQLGFVRAVVLAYTVPGASDLIAYRFREQNYQLNSIDFSVDRYQVDNSYSENFDIAAGAFLTSTETTFDRYPALSNVFADKGVVDYASPLAFEDINNRSITSIRALGGIDGINNIKNGDRLVFGSQEFRRGQNDIGDYNQGWSRVETLWDGEDWDNSQGTSTLGDDLGWDAASYVPGYNEHNLDPTVDDERIGIWEVSITDQIVTLTFVESMDFYDKVYVRNGLTYGGTNIYYDPVIKPGNLIPNYSIIPQQIQTTYTSFDGNGTRFFDYRDEYTEPGSGDKYIKFPKLGVFN